MVPVSGPVRLPPLPAWLRILGVAVCLIPGIAALVVFILSVEDVREFIGSILYTLVMFAVVVLPLTAVALAPPLCWAWGWRPGALGCSLYLSMIGVNFLFSTGDFSRYLSALFLLHVPLAGLLIWEWRSALQRRQATPGSLAAPSRDDH